MKGQALIWLREYVESCQGHCPSYKGNESWYSWAEELAVMCDFFMEQRGFRVSVAFQHEPSALIYKRIAPPRRDGEWDVFAAPTLGESLELCHTSRMLERARFVRLQARQLNPELWNTDQIFASLDLSRLLREHARLMLSPREGPESIRYLTRYQNP